MTQKFPGGSRPINNCRNIPKSACIIFALDRTAMAEPAPKKPKVDTTATKTAQFIEQIRPHYAAVAAHLDSLSLTDAVLGVYDATDKDNFMAELKLTRAVADDPTPDLAGRFIWTKFCTTFNPPKPTPAAGTRERHCASFVLWGLEILCTRARQRITPPKNEPTKRSREGMKSRPVM